ncbi:hypothetical protein [Pyxidicoccus sp. MSG2]|uniref:hypothetical protein n=1 Tax=Pyxidicoccus sp. MSG2 TaxID=2996790 RepID=UPI0022720E5F|nr:hypothetical protein [Pyxidicoccus sp. MSG2]MCY1024055.1 hypothetical protein [Pyxidicoccus sp. MSG2]
MSIPKSQPLTRAQLARRAELIQQLRAAHAANVPFVPLSFMVNLAGGAAFEERAARLTDIATRAAAARKLTMRDAEALVRIERAVLAELGFDPRTQKDPLQPTPETVPPSRSVREALLSGDSEAFLRVVRSAGLVAPTESTD